MSDIYYVGLKTGEDWVFGPFEGADRQRRDVFRMHGPMDKGYALNTLQRLVKEHGTASVELFCAAPWAARVSVHSDCDVKWEYPPISADEITPEETRSDGRET